MIACRYNQVEVAKLLISLEARPELRDKVRKQRSDGPDTDNPLQQTAVFFFRIGLP